MYSFATQILSCAEELCTMDLVRFQVQALLRLSACLHALVSSYLLGPFTRFGSCSLKINLLKPAGYVMHQQFVIQQLCALLTLYRLSQEEWTKLRESVPYVELYRYNPKHLYPKLNGYGDNGHPKVWASGVSTYCTPSVTPYSSTAHARQRDTAS